MKRNIREQLKEKDIKITELADYLGITRPTLYKFIDIFDDGKIKGIDSKALRVFRFIEKYPLCGKTQIISFIINDVNKSNDSQKKREEFDNIDTALIDFLNEVNSLLSKKKYQKTKQ